jgi:beta-glucosidase
LAKEHVPAILEAWYPGEFGGQAIAETLFGDNDPAGRLTISFPRSTGQLPDFYNTDPSRRHKYVGDDGEPLFPFGFGLSYTTFRYEHLAVQAPAAGSHGDVRVTVDVTNAGEREGDDVVQLYEREETTSVETPERSLCGFSRVRLRPHETRTVTFAVPQSQLAVWSAEGRWVVEPGSFTVWAGGDSRAALSAKFVLRP